jgi:hypothetical protein
MQENDIHVYAHQLYNMRGQKAIAEAVREETRRRASAALAAHRSDPDDDSRAAPDLTPVCVPIVPTRIMRGLPLTPTLSRKGRGSR